MKLSIRSRIFVAINSIVIICLSGLGFYYYNNTSSLIKNSAFETNHQILLRLHSSLDKTIKDVDRISAGVAFNPTVRQYFKNPTPSVMDDPEGLSMFSKLEDVLLDVNTSFFLAKQINLFNLQGDFIGVGSRVDEYKDKSSRYQHAAWIEPTLKAEGERQLNPPHLNTWHSKDELVFSVTRSIPVPRGQSPAIVEVQQPYSLLEQIATNEKSPEVSVYILDQTNRLFYPVSRQDPTAAELPFDPAYLIDIDEYGSEVIGRDGTVLMASVASSEYTGLTVVTLMSKANLMAPVHKIRSLTIIVVGLAVLTSLLISYIISITITSPLRYLQHYVRRMDIDNVSLVIPIPTKRFPSEIKELFDNHIHLRGRLHLSVNELINVKHREVLAHQQAMQAQLHPHFLYNTLTSIALLADKQTDKKVANLCYKLISMLRYLSLPVSEPVQLQQEVESAKNYLDMMKLRYEDRFDYEISLDSGLSEIRVPKLILMPLIENSFQHGFNHVLPPWKVSLDINQTVMKGDFFSIRIRDTGAGFDEVSLQRVQELTQRLNDGEIQNLEQISMRPIGGMGLENTLTRCRLFWKERVTFRIGNQPDGIEILIIVNPSE